MSIHMYRAGIARGCGTGWIVTVQKHGKNTVHSVEFSTEFLAVDFIAKLIKEA